MTLISKNATDYTAADAKRIAQLANILSCRRRAGSWSERAFVKSLRRELRKNSNIEHFGKDKFGNTFCRVGAPEPVALWSCHTDTVHTTSGYQKVVLSGRSLVVSRSDLARECLGADDGAGIFLLLEMIDAGVPGLYVFHRSEEIGGLGSKYFVSNEVAKWPSLKMAIAFDRRGFSEIITHQSTGKCASNEFAIALGVALGMGHAPSEFGSFTDTAFYNKAVPECVNVAAGYSGAHSASESQDIDYLLQLRSSLCSITQEVLEALPIVRDPSVHETRAYAGSYAMAGNWRGSHLNWEADGVSDLPSPISRYGQSVTPTVRLVPDPKPIDTKAISEFRGMSLEDIVKEFPEQVADYLEHAGFDRFDIIEHISQSTT